MALLTPLLPSPSPSGLRREHASWPRLAGAAFLASLAPILVAAQSSSAAPETFAGHDVAGLKRLSLAELMDVEVTSVSRRPERLSATPSAIQVITGEDIRRSGATTVPEALRLATNLAAARIDSRQWAISARGFNSTTSNKLLVLFDGRIVYSPLHGGVFWDVQDALLEDIDRIEVISGPGATLWGTNAVNGVVNLTTKHSKDTQGALVFGGGGDVMPGFGGVRYGGELAPGVHYRVYGKTLHRDPTELLNGNSADDAWDFTQGGFRVDWDTPGGDLVTIQGDLYDGAFNQLTPATETTPRADITVGGGNLTSRWTRQLSAQSSVQVQFYYDRTIRRTPGSYEEEVDTYDLDFQHRVPWGGDRHDLVWGLSTRWVHDDFTSPPTFGLIMPEVTQTWVGGFVQDEIDLVPDHLRFTLGSKFEHNDYTGLEVQPSVRAAWTPHERHTVWAAVSRAVRVPSRIDRELVSPRDPPYTVLVGGTEFESEELVAYEIGYRTRPHARVSAAVSTFYHDYDDLRSLEALNPPAPRPYQIGNGLRGESYGAEMTVDFRATDWLRFQAGYTRQLVDLSAKPTSNDTSGGSVESSDFGHQFSLRGAADLVAGLELDATFRHVGEIVNQGVLAYDELDVRLGWRPTDRLEFSLVGQSLLHDRHREFGSTGSRWIERSVHGRVALRF